MRTWMVVLTAAVLLAPPLVSRSSGGEPGAKENPWVGSYLLYDAEKGRPVPARRLMIVRNGDGYVLDGFRFTEIEKAISSDEKTARLAGDVWRLKEDILVDGKNAVTISVVSIPSAGGGRRTVLLVDSCYGPNFFMVRYDANEQEPGRTK